MQDYFNLTNDGVYVQKFFFSGTNVFQTWTKPKGARLIFMLAIGGGGGGGGGFTRTAGSQGGGGGGGGCSAISRIEAPAIMLPDELYINVGGGGNGSTGSGVAGSAGGLSSIAIWPATTAGRNLVLCSGAAGAGGGAAGTGAAAGSAGSAGTVATNISCGFSVMGTFVSTAGLQGGAGGLGNNVGTSVSLQTTLCCGGAGGGGSTSTNNAGGNISTPLFMNTITIPGGNPTGPVEAGDGIINWQPFYTMAGAGGYSMNSGVAGKGGNGEFGSGGGGGGAGATGGAGGRGGDGLIIIVSV